MKNTLSEIGGQKFIGTMVLPSCYTIDEWIEKFCEMGIGFEGNFYKYGEPMKVNEFWETYCANCEKDCLLYTEEAKECKHFQEVFGE